MKQNLYIMMLMIPLMSHAMEPGESSSSAAGNKGTGRRWSFSSFRFWRKKQKKSDREAYVEAVMVKTTSRASTSSLSPREHFEDEWMLSPRTPMSPTASILKTSAACSSVESPKSHVSFNSIIDERFDDNTAVTYSLDDDGSKRSVIARTVSPGRYEIDAEGRKNPFYIKPKRRSVYSSEGSGESSESVGQNADAANSGYNFPLEAVRYWVDYDGDEDGEFLPLAYSASAASDPDVQAIGVVLSSMRIASNTLNEDDGKPYLD